MDKDKSRSYNAIFSPGTILPMSASGTPRSATRLLMRPRTARRVIPLVIAGGCLFLLGSMYQYFFSRGSSSHTIEVKADLGSTINVQTNTSALGTEPALNQSKFNSPIIKAIPIKTGNSSTGPAEKQDTSVKVKPQSQPAKSLVAQKPAESEFSPEFDKFAVALKTGKEVALQRTPIQLLTFLKRVRKKIVIGEAPGVTVGPYPMIDVYTDLYTNVSEVISRNGSALQKRFDVYSPVFKDTDLSKRSFSKRGDEVVPDENSLGWKADAHKNFPGFRELWKKFPDAEWFMMIDDDTYVFFRNLNDMLSHLDPDEPHYIGSDNMFVGCDGVSEWGQGPGFAHGGSGIVVSRGAMKKMMGVIDKCITKYRDCWAGDVRVALCLRDVGVKIKDYGGFHRDPPHEKFHFGEPCYLPFTFHHLLVPQIQKLADLDERLSYPPTGSGRDARFVNFGDVYLDWHGGVNDSVIMRDTDRVGGDYKNIAVQFPDDCLKVCLEQPQCASFSYSNGRCWLKKEIPPVTVRKGFSSGVVARHFTCNPSTMPQPELQKETLKESQKESQMPPRAL